MPIISCRFMTTIIASRNPSSVRCATSHSGTGYEPTTVVRMSRFMVVPSAVASVQLLLSAGGRELSEASKCFLHVALVVALLDGGALVELFLALRQAKQDFSVPPLEVNF